MPEGKITRQRLKDHLRRLWAVYLIGAVALCFLNHLVFAVTRPGYSEAETLRIMLVNADISLQEDSLLSKAEPLGFRAMETLNLGFAPQDATSRMLLITQLVSGNGDIYIADGAGFSLLQERGACRAVYELQNGLYLAAVNNEQNVQAALEILIDELGE